MGKAAFVLVHPPSKIQAAVACFSPVMHDIIMGGLAEGLRISRHVPTKACQGLRCALSGSSHSMGKAAFVLVHPPSKIQAAVACFSPVMHDIIMGGLAEGLRISRHVPTKACQGLRCARWGRA